jgi:hypothetical protein
VIISKPPYGIAPVPFRFSALAALAGRAPLGGQREVALATYLSVRLADDVIAERGLSKTVRVERAGHARNWLSTLALPSLIRPALVRLIEASAAEPFAVGQALAGVIAATAGFLDPPARSELDHLASTLEAQALVK